MIAFLLTLVIGGTIAGDLLKASGMRRLGEVDEFHPGALARVARLASRSGLLWLSIVAYAVSFFGFMALVSTTDVSFAVPATAAGYVVETLLARWVLREEVSLRRWSGAVLVVAGVALVGG